MMRFMLCQKHVHVRVVLIQWPSCSGSGSAQGQGCTWGLEVQRHHLAASVPEDLRHVITGVHAASFGVDPAHLPLVVAARWPMRKRHTGRGMQMGNIVIYNLQQQGSKLHSQERDLAALAELQESI